MKRTHRKRNENGDSVQGRSGEKKVVGGALSSQGAKNSAENAEAPEAGNESGSTKQLVIRKSIKNKPHPSAETLLNRYKFDESLQRGLLQAAKNNSPLPEWLLRRNSFDRVGEFYVRLKAELVAPERRDQAKIKRMLAELHSSQQKDGADGTMPGQGHDQVEEIGQNVGEVLVEQHTKVMHQQLTGGGKHMQQSSTKLNPHTERYYDALRKGLLKAAEKGILPNGWIQHRSVAGLGDFWVRLKKELLSTKRDQPKIERMLDELRASEQRVAETAGDELVSHAEAEQDRVEEEEEEEETASGQWRRHGELGAVRLRDQQDGADDGSDDDVFVRWPRRRQQQLARHQVEEEL